MSEQPAIELADVEAAAVRIAPFVRRTPVVTSTTISSLVGAEVFCKAESMQRTGSFKMRGASNAIAALTPEQRSQGIVSFSSGNHAQAISRAASMHDCSATIVMPTDAPRIKREATERWGARVVEYDRYTQSREEITTQLHQEIGGIVIPPFDHRDVMAGQGTVALELFDAIDELDMLFVCVGGGGLLSGCSTVAKTQTNNVVVVGVEPEAGDDHLRSHAAGRRVELDAVPRTIADGQQNTAPGVLTWSVNSVRADIFTTVTDAEIVQTMRLLLEHHNIVVEPSGATALAAVLHSGLVEPGMRVGATLSGGNIDLTRFAALITGQ